MQQKTLILIGLFIVLANLQCSKAQSNASLQEQFRLIIIPNTEHNLCDILTENSDKRQVVEEVSQYFNTKKVKTANFMALLRQIKNQGACDGFNPQKPLNALLQLSQSQAYFMVEHDLQEEAGQWHISLSLSLYDTQTRRLLLYASKVSDDFSNRRIRNLVQNAMNKVWDEIYTSLLDNYNTTAPLKIAPNSISLQADVDNNLPKTLNPKHKGIAVVIGNSAYKYAKKVDFAIHDALVIKKYLIEVLGYEEANIFYIENALKSDFEQLFGIKDNPKGKLFNTVPDAQTEIFIFYAGHGATGLNDKNSYFVPVESNPQYVELSGYNTDIFYQNLAQLPTQNITIILDACFSGIDLYQNISPVRVRNKGALHLPEATILSASQADEVAGWYNEKQHGLLTYFFLKAIHERNADSNKDKRLTWQEIYDFIADKSTGLPFWARKLHNINQNPMLRTQKADKVLIKFE